MMIEVHLVDGGDDVARRVVEHHAQEARLEATNYRGSVTRDRNTESRRVYVATVGESAVGSLVVHVDARGEWDIEFVHVLRDARGIGIGNALMQRLIEDATANGATRLASVALPGDRSTKNLFERFGLIAQAIVVAKDLRP